MYRVLIALSAIGIMGCSGTIYQPDGPRTSVTVTRFRTEPYPFSVYSSVSDAERVVIRDAVTWQAAWASLFPARAPIPAPPNVDFTKEMVVFAALGSRPTGGFGILVDSAAITSSGLLVWVGTLSPGPHCVTTQAFTSPADIARLPRTDMVVHFADVPKVAECQ